MDTLDCGVWVGVLETGGGERDGAEERNVVAGGHELGNVPLGLAVPGLAPASIYICAQAFSASLKRSLNLSANKHYYYYYILSDRSSNTVYNLGGHAF